MMVITFLDTTLVCDSSCSVETQALILLEKTIPPIIGYYSILLVCFSHAMANRLSKYPQWWSHAKSCEFGPLSAWCSEKAMTSHSSTLACKIPWTEEPGSAVPRVAASGTRLSSFAFTFHFHALEKEMATHSNILAWESQGRGAWWATVYGVAQSRTRLKRLSSSSSSSLNVSDDAIVF